MNFAIVSNIGNGIGLQCDYELLKKFLEDRGHSVTGINWLEEKPPVGFDVAIFLETLPLHMMGIAKQNWAFPNCEWLKPDGERLLRKRFSKIFAKTHDAHRILSGKFDGVHYVGFLARDKYDWTVPRKRQFLHIGGNGGYRNTAQVLEAWRSCRYWQGIPAEDAPLIIVSASTTFEHIETPGVTYHKRLDDAEIKRLQNESLFHILPSAYEGYGHALHEAMSVGAWVITTDAAPMNEIGVGVYVPSIGTEPCGAAVLHKVAPTDIREKVNFSLSRFEKGAEAFVRENVRAKFLEGNEEFERLMTPHLTVEPDKKYTVCIHGNHAISFCTERDLAWTFEDLGHKVISTQENADTTEEVLERCIKENVKLFVYIHTHGWETPGRMDMAQLLQELKACGIKTCSFHLDRYRGLNLSDGRESRVGTHPFWHTDVVFTADGGNQEWFKDRGVNHVWLPPAVVKKWAVKGNYRADLAVDVAFVGARGYHPEYPFRETLIKFLEDTYGSRFKIFSGFREQSLNDLYASARVVVGDSCFGGADRYWSDRVPETTGRGGFLIHPASNGLSIPGLVTYTPGDLNDLTDKIDYYLEHEDERKALQGATQAWVREHDTYTNRVQTMLKVVGL